MKRRSRRILNCRDLISSPLGVRGLEDGISSRQESAPHHIMQERHILKTLTKRRPKPIDAQTRNIAGCVVGRYRVDEKTTHKARSAPRNQLEPEKTHERRSKAGYCIARRQWSPRRMRVVIDTTSRQQPAPRSQPKLGKKSADQS